MVTKDAMAETTVEVLRECCYDDELTEFKKYRWCEYESLEHCYCEARSILQEMK